jgi:hypothetical protein
MHAQAPAIVAALIAGGKSRSGRQQLEGINVERTDGAEVAVVEGGELRFVEALDDSHDGGVDEADIGVGVAIAELADAELVLGQEVFDAEEASNNVIDKR